MQYLLVIVSSNYSLNQFTQSDLKMDDSFILDFQWEKKAQSVDQTRTGFILSQETQDQ